MGLFRTSCHSFCLLLVVCFDTRRLLSGLIFVPVCAGACVSGVCVANGEKHHNHAVISTKAAAAGAKAAVEGYEGSSQLRKRSRRSKQGVSPTHAPLRSAVVTRSCLCSASHPRPHSLPLLRWAAGCAAAQLLRRLPNHSVVLQSRPFSPSPFSSIQPPHDARRWLIPLHRLSCEYLQIHAYHSAARAVSWGLHYYELGNSGFRYQRRLLARVPCVFHCSLS